MIKPKKEVSNNVEYQDMRPPTSIDGWKQWFDTKLRAELEIRGVDLAAPDRLARSVLRLSDHYVANPDSESPWQEDWAVDALLGYYHPLNLSRADHVAQRGRELGFFDGFKTLLDWGCGSGAASLSVVRYGQVDSVTLLDRNRSIAELAGRLHATVHRAENPQEHRRRIAIAPPDGNGIALEPTTLLILSYILTELSSEASMRHFLDPFLRSSVGGLMLIEPSTAADARRLQSLRTVLSENGFFIWAPCTHTEDCPLLLHSEKDWCHDRTEPILPEWWPRLEAKLPIKNESVTMSYLLARRTPPRLPTGSARVTGDTLKEKGKSRQLLCRSNRREFLSWFPQRLEKRHAAFSLKRGELISLAEDEIAGKKGSEHLIELRLKESAIKRLHGIGIDRD